MNDYLEVKFQPIARTKAGFWTGFFYIQLVQKNMIKSVWKDEQNRYIKELKKGGSCRNKSRYQKLTAYEKYKYRF
jgi:hypothetical protein